MALQAHKRILRHVNEAIRAETRQNISKLPKNKPISHVYVTLSSSSIFFHHVDAYEDCTVILPAYERFISRSGLNRYTHASLGLKYKPMALMSTPDACASLRSS
jgi:hypothetical protein